MRIPHSPPFHSRASAYTTRVNAERIREFLLGLPHVVETMQWGENLVFWVGDKAIGGKMFTLCNLDEDRRAIISFAAGPEGYAELLEREGMTPAPYLARIYWVAAERWDVLRDPEWENVLRSAHALTMAKLPKRTRDVLAMPASAQRKLIAERRKLLAAAKPRRSHDFCSGRASEEKMRSMAFDPQQHWEEIYRTRDESALSWFEDRPEATLDILLPLVPQRDAPVVEVGGGTSRVVDLLLEHGYTSITVLDIAEAALEISRSRLAARAGEITWVHASVLDWQPASPIRLWHDRAVFHFFTRQQEREAYALSAARAVAPGGFAVLEIFAPDGPPSCSGLPVYRATPEDIAAEFSPTFRLRSSKRHTHTTPTAAKQNFQTIVLERDQP